VVSVEFVRAADALARAVQEEVMVEREGHPRLTFPALDAYFAARGRGESQREGTR
jgi:hypothetical protein